MFAPVSEITNEKPGFSGVCRWRKSLGPLTVVCRGKSIILPSTHPRFQMVGFFKLGFRGRNYDFGVRVFRRSIPSERAFGKMQRGSNE